MAIYTRAGDAGRTTVGSKIVRKSSIEIKALGEIDELNSFLGLAKAHCSQRTVQIISRLQHDLFRVQAELGRASQGYEPIKSRDVTFLEGTIDYVDSTLPKLTKFVLPEGAVSASLLHVSRTICRRAERTLFVLDAKVPIGALTLSYINRLSTLLFVLARYENSVSGVQETNPDYSAF